MKGGGWVKKRDRAREMEKVKEQLRRMAYGKANDCVKLALCTEVDIDKLDLSLLTEIKRSDKGVVEIKLVDRIRVLERLAAMAGDGNEQAEEFLQLLVKGMDDGV